LVLYPMTDIGGGIFALIVTAIFLKFWKPRQEWHFDKKMEPPANTAEPRARATEEPPLTVRRVSVAWAPYVLMSLLLLATGLVRQKEQHGPLYLGSVQTKYALPIYDLHNQSYRDPRLVASGAEP